VTPPVKNAPSDRNLALAVTLSLLLHALLCYSWPLKDPAETPLRDDDIPLEVTSGPALAPAMDACPPDFAPLPPEPAEKSRPTNRHERIKKYLIRVRKAVEHNKFYPPGKKNTRMIGNVLIEFSITARGSFTQIRVRRSSGDPGLDRTAIKAVAHTSGQVKRPACTGGDVIHTSVVVKYQYGL